MKRSEMINNILDEMTKLYGEQIGHEFEVKLANLILDRIEKAGMLPPQRVIIKEEINEVKDLDYNFITTSYHKTNTWDQE